MNYTNHSASEHGDAYFFVWKALGVRQGESIGEAARREAFGPDLKRNRALQLLRMPLRGADGWRCIVAAAKHLGWAP